MKLREVIVLSLLASMTGCARHDDAAGGSRGAGGGAKAAAPAVPVSVASVERRDVPVEIAAIGAVQPRQQVVIKAQVPGELSEVHFREGQDVKAGDILFTIDPRPYQIAVQQAQAQFAADNVMARDAQDFADRLAGAGPAATERDVEAAKNKAASLKAALQTDQAAIDNAKLKLSYTEIRSPIDGRTGDLKVDRGNIIKENETELVSIMQIEPIDVAFSVPEGRLDEVRRRMSSQTELTVDATIPGAASTEPVRGALTFIDNNVDRNTGAVTLKGTFANADRRLWPGRFVNVVLNIDVRHDAVIVPSVAIQKGQKGQHVFVVAAGGQKVELRPVKAGGRLGEETIIESGLSGGEQVVTDGHTRLTDGSSISIKPPVGQTRTADAAGSGPAS